jgi:hypothetical protein
LIVVVEGATSHSAPGAHPLLLVPVVTQVQVAGQSESALHETAFGSQCFVVDGVQVQSGGGSVFGGGANPPVPVGAGTGSCCGVDVEGGAGAPALGDPPTPDAPAEPEDEPDEPVPLLGVAVPLPPLHVQL